ncbi:FliM/FliN family flagellar motor C-terminal domain-containing protein [Pantoea sp. A4]|uniref:FliM/FliN family flagellar motor C-terminal domain-containing protein n=1 Tax=Pantoea sp. A4 TaxID=1225184 RepID=UPI00037D196C|nr:FliM/FliN family flagellar motor C-terminal domain-containing protein [Pantoea sp. A4]
MGKLELSNINITLTIRYGKVCLSLKELSELSEGSIIKLCNSNPSQATLWHEDRYLGTGELVESNIGIGFLITSLGFDVDTFNNDDIDGSQ